MLSIPGPPSRYCDGISRRSAMQIGALGFGGLTLPGLLRAEAQQTAKPSIGSARAIIMVILPGGPSHLDMYDLKPNAPKEIRGEFKPIATSVRGIDICELMPRLAKIASRVSRAHVPSGLGGHVLV